MPQFRADLHCHSSCSDGSLDPDDLVQMAITNGLQGLSITDHDTVEAYQKVKPHQLALISGVEFSASLLSKSVHILGYSFTLTSPEILKLCHRHLERRAARNREILDKLAKLGMPLTSEEVAVESKGAVGRPHIGLALMKKGYVGSVQEAFKRFIGSGKPAYAEGFPISVEETLDAIHTANGLAVIAHPHLIEESMTLKRLLEMGFDGLECYYARFSPESNAPWVEMAQKRGLLTTGGSDFHGAIKPNIALGDSWIGEETFRILEERHRRNNP